MENRKNNAMTPAIRIENLSVAFAGRRVLNHLNLEIPAGGPTFLLGRSGSGKTTFLRAINRLNECFPECVTEGRVQLHVGGEWIDAYSPELAVDQLRRRVGMVFQAPNVLPLSIARNIAMPLQTVLALSESEIEARIETSLREVHLWDEVCDRLAAPAQSLSGGQQQRLCLARALALEPEILLLDEPTASLDFRAAQQIEALLAELASRYTLVVVSHSLSQAHRLAAQMFVLREGVGVDAVPAALFGNSEALLEAMDRLI